MEMWPGGSLSFTTAPIVPTRGRDRSADGRLDIVSQ